MGKACGLGLEAHTATPTLPASASASCPAQPLWLWETERVCDRLFLQNLPGVIFGVKRPTWRSLEAPCPIKAKPVAGENDRTVTAAKTLPRPSWACFPWGKGGRS